jgi:hypothetical protein
MDFLDSDETVEGVGLRRLAGFWPVLASVWPVLAGVWPALAEIWPVLAGFWPLWNLRNERGLWILAGILGGIFVL